jgi:hypothetical protein
VDNSFKIKSIILMVLIMTSLLRSQAAGISGGPNAFYKLPLTAREASLGGAGVAISRGPLSALWNPSSIVDRDNWLNFGGNIKLSQNENMLTSDLYILGVSAQLHEDHLIFGGLSFIQRKVLGIEKTRLVYDEIELMNGQSSLSENLLIVSLAGSIRGASAGVNLRPTWSRLDNIGWKNLFNLDLGFLMSEDAWDYGFVMKLDSDSLNTDLSFGTGGAIKLQIIPLLWTVDLTGGLNIAPELATGFELGEERIFGRVGLNLGFASAKVDFSQIVQRFVSAGIGIRSPLSRSSTTQKSPWTISMDFSYTSYFTTDLGDYMSFVDFPFKLSLILKK